MSYAKEVAESTVQEVYDRLKELAKDDVVRFNSLDDLAYEVYQSPYYIKVIVKRLADEGYVEKLFVENGHKKIVGVRLLK